MGCFVNVGSKTLQQLKLLACYFIVRKVEVLEERRIGIGQKLLGAGLITPQQLDLALKEQRRTGKLLETILVELGFITKDELNTFLSAQRGLRFITDLIELTPDSEALELVPRDVARRLRVVPLALDGDSLMVCFSDPDDVIAQDELVRITKKSLKIVVGREEDILYCINNWYLSGSQAMVDELISEAVRLAIDGKQAIGEEAPVVKLVDQIIVDAIKSRATDIHIEPEEKVVIIRYRIDGVLHVMFTIPKIIRSSCVSRVKLMAGMDISETRLPQDGKLTFKLGARKVDLRVSTFPTRWGESVAIRILDRAQAPLNLELLGMDRDLIERFRKVISSSYGMVLVTGPTGSGKTTTLYSALLVINSTEKNIVTIEDPIEFELPMINQSQINEKAGFTFSEGLKHILRHDPDIIFIGEIRDRKTADMAVRAALTGHLIFSTLHTKRAAGAIPRLVDMGIEPYLLSSALSAVISQRLVRKVCTNCREDYEAGEEELRVLREYGFDSKPVVLARSRGCEKCMGTGYLGRTGIFELIEATDEISSLILRGAPEKEIEKAALASGMVPLKVSGMRKVIEGITTLDEVLRVI